MGPSESRQHNSRRYPIRLYVLRSARGERASRKAVSGLRGAHGAGFAASSVSSIAHSAAFRPLATGNLARPALEEEGVADALHSVGTLTEESQEAEHRARCPWSKVPVLEHDRFSLSETVARARFPIRLSRVSTRRRPSCPPPVGPVLAGKRILLTRDWERRLCAHLRRPAAIPAFPETDIRSFGSAREGVVHSRGLPNCQRRWARTVGHSAAMML